MRERAEEQIAEKQRLEAAQESQTQEVIRLKAENQRIQAQAEVAKREAEAVAWVANNKKEITAELTKTYGPVKQQALDALGIHGRALGFLVIDVSFEDDVLYFAQLFLWQKPDGNGGMIRVVSGQNVKTNQFVFNKVTATRNFSANEIADILGNDSNQKIENVIATTKPSTWSPSNETVNSGYQAAIKVAATAAGVYILSLISGN